MPYLLRALLGALLERQKRCSRSYSLELPARLKQLGGEFFLAGEKYRP
tara:strand:- start:299 stop:442 length:144 start_codon:yes stop_codon:yes gene_type:complete